MFNQQLFDSLVASGMDAAQAATQAAQSGGTATSSNVEETQSKLKDGSLSDLENIGLVDYFHARKAARSEGTGVVTKEAFAAIFENQFYHQGKTVQATFIKLVKGEKTVIGRNGFKFQIRLLVAIAAGGKEHKFAIDAGNVFKKGTSERPEMPDNPPANYQNLTPGQQLTVGAAYLGVSDLDNSRAPAYLGVVVE